MGILKIVCLLVFSLFLSLGNASAAGWTAGPGLTPSDDFPLFKTVKRRLGLSTAKIPHSGKEFSIELHVFGRTIPAGFKQGKRPSPVRLDGLAGRCGETVYKCGTFGNDDL